MPSFETVDRLEIAAPAARLFETVLDYPRMHEWDPPYRVEVIGGGPVVEGARLRHQLKTGGLTTRFVRTIQRIDVPKAIEETYDEGALIGRGRWEFEALAPERTRVSFWCAVRSNSLLMHVGILLTGTKGHNKVYQEILAALRERCT